jgi:hypothetical protein
MLVQMTNWEHYKKYAKQHYLPSLCPEPEKGFKTLGGSL